MKSILLLCLFLSIVPAHPGKFDELYISITMTVSEHSMDSNSTKRTAIITGNKLVYDETRSGYSPRKIEPVHKVRTLTNEEMVKLKGLIKDRNLMTSRSVTFPVTNTHYTSYEMTDEIRWNGKTSSIKITGPVNSEEMQINQVYKDADSLWTLVKSMVDAG